MSNYVNHRWNSQQTLPQLSSQNQQPITKSQLQTPQQFSQAQTSALNVNSEYRQKMGELENARARVVDAIKTLQGDQLRLAKIRLEQLNQDIANLQRQNNSKSMINNNPPYLVHNKVNQPYTNSYGQTTQNINQQGQTGAIPVERYIQQKQEVVNRVYPHSQRELRTNINQIQPIYAPTSQRRIVNWVNTSNFNSQTNNTMTQPIVYQQPPVQTQVTQQQTYIPVETNRNYVNQVDDKRVSETQAFIQNMDNNNDYKLTQREQERFTESLNHVKFDPEFSLDNYETYVDEQGNKHIRYVVKRNVYGETQPIQETKVEVSQSIENRTESIQRRVESERNVEQEEIKSPSFKNTSQQKSVTEEQNQVEDQIFQQKPIEHVTYDKNGNPVKVYTTIDENGQPLQIINIIQNEIEIQYVSYIDENGKQKVKLLKEFLEEQENEENNNDSEAVKNIRQLDAINQDQIKKRLTEESERKVNTQVGQVTDNSQNRVTRYSDNYYNDMYDSNKDDIRFASLEQKQRAPEQVQVNSQQTEPLQQTADFNKQKNEPIIYEEVKQEDQPESQKEEENIEEQAPQSTKSEKEMLLKKLDKTKEKMEKYIKKIEELNSQDQSDRQSKKEEAENKQEVQSRSYSERNMGYVNKTEEVRRQTEHQTYNREEPVINRTSYYTDVDVRTNTDNNKGITKTFTRRYHTTEYQGRSNPVEPLVRREQTELRSNTVTDPVKIPPLARPESETRNVQGIDKTYQRSQTDVVRRTYQSERIGDRSTNNEVVVENMIMNGLKIRRRSLSRTKKTGQVIGGQFTKKTEPIKYETVGEVDEDVSGQQQADIQVNEETQEMQRVEEHINRVEDDLTRNDIPLTYTPAELQEREDVPLTYTPTELQQREEAMSFGEQRNNEQAQESLQENNEINNENSEEVLVKTKDGQVLRVKRDQLTYDENGAVSLSMPKDSDLNTITVQQDENDNQSNGQQTSQQNNVITTKDIVGENTQNIDVANQ